MMFRPLTLAMLVALLPGAVLAQAPSILHIKVTLVDAARTALSQRCSA